LGLFTTTPKKPGPVFTNGKTWKYLRAKVKKAISNSSVAGTSKRVGGSDLPHEHGDVTTSTQRRVHTCHCTLSITAWH